MEIKDGKIVMEDGKSFTPEELKAQISKAEDYTKKTQAVAEERKRVEAMKAELDQKSASLSVVEEFAKTLEGDAELAKAVEDTMLKFRDKSGNAPAAGSSADNALSAELKALKADIDKIKNEKAEIENQSKLQQAYNTVQGMIDQSIKDVGAPLNDRQLKMIQNDAWGFAMSQKDQLTADAMKEYVESGIKGIVDPKILRVLQAKVDTTPVGGNNGAGGIQTSPDKVPLLGTKEWKDHFKNAFRKHNPNNV